MKVSIRDLLWLTVVAAMGCAWWVDHQKLANAFYQSPWYVRATDDYSVVDQFWDEPGLRPPWIKRP